MNCETFTVKVEQIHACASAQDVVMLFQNLIGPVQQYEERHDHGNRLYLFVTFGSFDTYRKALCMSGYNIAGTPLIVSPFGPVKQSGTGSNNQGYDTRRNLYVLGLPFDLTKTEFWALFSHYGTVTHCVILATVDNASRRRGFVVMSSHEEAKLAMNSLSRTSLRGNTMDVSWAVVQRSQGFLDGGDRNVILRSSSAPGIDNFCDVFSQHSIPSDDQDCQCFSTCAAPTATLLVTNLPTALFAQVEDLRPLFYPFGEIKQLKMVDNSVAEGRYGTTSAFVEYATIASARDARETLQGQLYASTPVNVQYVQTSASLANASHEAHSHSKNATISTGLNPFAAPFILNSVPSFPLCLGLGDRNQQSDFSKHPPLSSGLPADTPCFALHAIRPSLLQAALTRPDTLSRSSSVTSSRSSIRLI